LAAQIKEQLPRTIEYEELVAYGTQGLLEAAQRFDPKAGASFQTFSYYRIRGAIYDGLRHMGWLSRVEYAKWRAGERASDYLEEVQRRDEESEITSQRGVDTQLKELSQTLSGIATVFVTSLAESEHRIADDAPGSDERLGELEL